MELKAIASLYPDAVKRIADAHGIDELDAAAALGLAIYEVERHGVDATLMQTANGEWRAIQDSFVAAGGKL